MLAYNFQYGYLAGCINIGCEDKQMLKIGIKEDLWMIL